MTCIPIYHSPETPNGRDPAPCTYQTCTDDPEHHTVRLNSGPIVGYLCVADVYRLRLTDGGYVYMEWHHYHGPEFYHDRALMREIEKWWRNKVICQALDWFEGRGNKA